MSPLQPENADSLVALWTEKASTLVESLNQAFDGHWTLTPGSARPFDPSEFESLRCGGVAIAVAVGEQRLLLLLPVGIGLPEWYTAPNKSQRSRLDTLAMEWSLNLLPEDVPGDAAVAVIATDLLATAAACEPDLGCVAARIDCGLGDEGDKSIVAIWPAAKDPVETAPPAPASAPATAVSQSGGSHDGNPATASVAMSATGTGGVNATLSRRAQRLYRLGPLSVPVIVKLAEKKISVGELQQLSPGAIVIFEKPCDELLDLFVNNRLYCRGEAVKIGEKFGLKVNEVGSRIERPSAIIT
jgi:flagellar motor switch protein FliN/FliY